MTPSTSQQVFPASRWLNVLVRGLHLVAVIQFCAGVLAHPAAEPSGGLAVLLTGLTLWALDLRQHPAHLRQMVGLSMLVKLLLVAAMMHLSSLRLPLLWTIVIVSALFSHAPSRFRNARPGWRR